MHMHRIWYNSARISFWAKAYDVLVRSGMAEDRAAHFATAKMDAVYGEWGI